MYFRTLSSRVCLFCYAFLFLLASACDSPDYKPQQNQSSQDTSTDSTNEHDTGFIDSDTSSPIPDAQNSVDANIHSDSDVDTVTTPDVSHDTTPTPIAPSVTIKSAPDIFTSEKVATITFECNQSGCTFECSMNSPFSNCTSPMTYNNLDDTEYTFIVRAKNPTGDVSPDAIYTWTVDTAAPKVINLTGPAAYTSLKTADITFNCNETDCTFECALNESNFVPCASPTQYTNLPDRKHKVSVRATDLAANIGEPAVTTWTVDTVKPNVTILTTPPNPSYLSSATFTFECNEPGCKLACSIDNGTTFQNCTSPKSYENLERKPQTFTVRATDQAGNIGLSTPHKWTVTWPKWVQVGVGTTHACGIIDDGTLWCWGKSSLSAVLGQKTIKESAVPLRVESASDWQYVSSNSMFNCGIRNGTLYCWGFILDGTPEPDSVMKRIIGTDWNSIAVGSFGHYCGLRNNQQIWCWGTNAAGKLGIGNTSNQVEPVRVTGNNWRSVATGKTHTCAVNTSNHLYCWGSNSHGQLARNSQDTSLHVPTQITTLDIFHSVGLGEYHTIISTFDEPWVSGKNDSGQLGLGHYNERAYRSGLPFSFRGMNSFTGGTSFSCGILSQKIYCTGRNDYGQLGRGNITVRENTFQPIKAPGIEFTSVDAGGEHACAIDTNGNIWCWGGAPEKSTPTQLPWPY